MVLFLENLKISKSMKQVLRKNDFTITENKAFTEVIFNCRHIQREEQEGTWITNDMEEAYIALHQKGYAKSIEVWRNQKLVGGLYGVDLRNGVFCGESMFSKESNMSKIAFIHLVQNGGYKLIDCQVYNEHLASLGALEISREEFLKWLS
jgi:leucyl/phenylalanyl-tRNA--protein transferase